MSRLEGIATLRRESRLLAGSGEWDLAGRATRLRVGGLVAVGHPGAVLTASLLGG